MLVYLDLNHDHPASLLFLVMSQESYPILNPVVYLNYLNHTIADDYEITRNVSLVTLGVRRMTMISDSYISITEGPGLGHSFEYSRGLEVDSHREHIYRVVCLLLG